MVCKKREKDAPVTGPLYKKKGWFFTKCLLNIIQLQNQYKLGRSLERPYIMRQITSVENYGPIWKHFEIIDQTFIKNNIIHTKSCTAVTKELKKF